MRGVKNQDGSVATPQQIYDAFMGGRVLFRISDDNFGNLYAYVAPEAITWADANGTQNDPTNVVGVKIYWSSVSITIGTMPAEFN